MICANILKHFYYVILVSIIIDYEKYVLITKIKGNMQYSVCHVSVQKQENLIKTCLLQTS